jgi:hypothetical protein
MRYELTDEPPVQRFPAVSNSMLKGLCFVVGPTMQRMRWTRFLEIFLITGQWLFFDRHQRNSTCRARAFGSMYWGAAWTGLIICGTKRPSIGNLPKRLKTYP